MVISMDDLIIHPNDFIETTYQDPWWDEYNPWREHLVYVPLQDLAKCVLGFGKDIDTNETVPVTYGYDLVMRIWRQNGHRLDGYILVGPVITAGVRYGPDPGGLPVTRFLHPQAGHLAARGDQQAEEKETLMGHYRKASGRG